MTKSIIRAAAACGAIALALAGCGKNTADSKTITVLTHNSFSIPEGMIEAFEEESGYNVKVVSAGDAGVANQLVLTKGSPKYDAFYGIDNYTAGVAQAQGVLADFTPSNLPASAEQYVRTGLTPIDVGDVCMNIDHGWFASNGVAAPTSLDDFAKPEYAKLTAIINPADSATGFAFLAGVHTAKGEDADEFLAAMLGGGAKVASGWSEAYYEYFSAGEGKGDYPIVLSYASSPAETEGATGPIDATCVRQIEFAGVVEGTDNAEGAQAFVEFLLTEDFQAAIPESMYMYPVDTRVALPEAWAQYATLTENPIIPDVDDVNTNRDAWLDSWAEIAQK